MIVNEEPWAATLELVGKTPHQRIYREVVTRVLRDVQEEIAAGPSYQVLIGQERGPRFGSFVALYGIDETRALIREALEGRLVAQG